MNEKEWIITVCDNYNEVLPLEIYDFCGNEQELKKKMLLLVSQYRCEDLSDCLNYTSRLDDIDCQQGKYLAYIEFSYRTCIITATPKCYVKSLDEVQIFKENPLLNELSNQELEEYFDFTDQNYEILAIYENYERLGEEYAQKFCLDTFLENAINLESLGNDLAHNNDDYYLFECSGRIVKLDLSF